MVVVVKQVAGSPVRRTAPKLKLFLKPKLRRGRGSSSFNRRVREERANIERANTKLRQLGLPIEKFAGESSIRLNQRIAQENARRQADIQRQESQARDRALKESQRQRAIQIKIQRNIQKKQVLQRQQRLTLTQREKLRSLEVERKKLDQQKATTLQRPSGTIRPSLASQVNIPSGTGRFTAAVDVGEGKMQDAVFTFSKGRITATNLLGKAVPQSKRFKERQIQKKSRPPKGKVGVRKISKEVTTAASKIQKLSKRIGGSITGRATTTQRKELKKLKNIIEKEIGKQQKRFGKFVKTKVTPFLDKANSKAEGLLFGFALGTKPKGTGLSVQPEFSKGEKFSLRTANVYAGVQFDKVLRRSKKYKTFSDDIDEKVNKNKFAKFTKDNILQPISEDVLLLAATSPFLKSSTALKNEFLLDEIVKLNKAGTRQISLGLKKVGKGGSDEILLASTKSSKNFKIQTLTNYKVKTIKGKVVIAQQGKGVTKLINKRTGKIIGKPVEFTFFGKGKPVSGRFVRVGKEGEKVIQDIGKTKLATGQVKILTKDLKVIKSRFGSLFKNQKNVELSLSGGVKKISSKVLKIKDLKLQGVRKSKLNRETLSLLKKVSKKMKLLGTKKTVKLNIDDLAVIRKFSPKSYSKIIEGSGTRVTGTGKNLNVLVKQTDIGKAIGQRVTKQVENLLSGGVSKGIARSNSVDRIIKSAAAVGGISAKAKKVAVGLGGAPTKIKKATVPKRKTPILIKKTTTAVTTRKATRTKTTTIPATKEKVIDKTKTKPVSKTKPVQKEKTKQKPRLKLRLELRERARLRALTRLKIKPKITKKLILIKKKKKKGKKGVALKDDKQSFDVFAKPVKGKRLIKINIKALSETDAKDLRNFIIDTSLSRQGAIKPGKGKPNKPKIKVPKGFAKKTSFKFRRFRTKRKKRIRLAKGRVIEKRSRLLDTRQERRKISLRKRIKQLRPKKKTVKKKVVKRKVTKKTNQSPNINTVRRREMLANLEKARRVKALQQSSQARASSSTRRTTRRRIISII